MKKSMDMNGKYENMKG